MNAFPSRARRLAAASLVAAALVAGARPVPARTGPLPLPSPVTLAPEDLHPGDHAVVRTVFQGTAVDSFDAVIVGTLAGGRTEGTTILARATSDRVVQSGVAQGMSGSPVFVHGKLIGALSTAFAFSKEPIFGVTPIREMLELWRRPESQGLPFSSGPSGAEVPGMATPLRFRELTWTGDSAATPAITSAPEPGLAATPRALALPLACAGLDPVAAEVAGRWLAPLGFTAVPGGHASAEALAAPPLEPGSAVAIDVLRGDLELSAIGTVTWRDGDRVLLFGHPFFQSGDVRMPLSTASIATIVSSEQISFKMGARGREVGAVLQDRRTGVAGRLGATAEMLPLSVVVRGAAPDPQTFHFEAIQDRGLGPIVVGIAVMNSVLESGGQSANQTLQWTLTLHGPQRPPLVITDVVASDTPPSDLGGAVIAPLKFLFGNPFARLDLDSLSVAIDVVPGRHTWTLESARLLEASVPPGGVVHVTCELERWRGDRVTKTLALTVPPQAPPGRYVLWVGGGSELARYEAARLPGRYRATSLEDAWARLGVSRSSSALYGSLFARAPEVNDAGRDYPELPASAVFLMAGDQSAADRGRRGDLARLDEQHVELPGLVHGEFALGVTVDAHGSLREP